MDIKNILSHCDHTLLTTTATWPEIKALCDDAIKYEVASVCIPPCHVPYAVAYLNGKVKVCTVIGFPNGYATSSVKLAEANAAIFDGVDEIDMVINVGKVKEHDYDYVKNEIKNIADLCHYSAPTGKRIVLKVIVETCLLTKEEIEKMCEICYDVGADYIKTSTGFSTGGATFGVVKLMVDTISKNYYNLKVKASGGISSLEDAQRYLDIGADRLGTSKVVKEVKAREA